MPGCEHGWFTSPSSRKQLHYRKFLPEQNKKPKAIVVYHHGIQSHSGAAWVTKSDNRKLNLAGQIEEYVKKQGFALYAMDQLGHGYSEGRRMHISNYKDNVRDLTRFCRLAASRHRKGTPLFLTGQSFGGCLMLHAARRFEKKPSSAPKGYKGICIVAPAIIGDAKPPPPRVMYILRRLLAPNYPAWVASFLPTPVSADRVWRDPEALALFTAPRYVEMGLETVGVPLNLGTVVQILLATEEVRERVIPALKTPFCVVHGTEDYGVPVEGTDFLEQHAATAKEDQSILRIDGAYHDLFADPAKEETLAFIVKFMKKRMSTKREESRRSCSSSNRDWQTYSREELRCFSDSEAVY